MFGAIYAIAFSLSVISLILWLLFKENSYTSRLFRLIFLISLAVAMGVVALSPVLFAQKLFVLARELFVLAIIGFLFKALLNNKIAFAGGFLLLVFGLGWYFSVLNQSLRPILPIPLDDAGELLLELQEGKDISSLESVLDNYSLTAAPAFSMKDEAFTELDDYYVIDIPDDKKKLIRKIKKALKRSGLVDWLEENEVIQIEPLISETEYSNKKSYGVNDPDVEKQWGFEHMGMQSFYQLLRQKGMKPKKQSRLFILDTGIDADHEDLAENYLSLRSTYDRDVRGHGTHCAGIAGAVSNNKLGIASFNLTGSLTSITSVKVLSDNGFGTQKSIINGILEAADEGADVISLSLGGRTSSRKQRAYRKAVEYANEKGAIVVVAAGNSAANARDFSPANTPGVICVAAIDTNLNLASFSNSVEDIDMGIASPGVSIYSTLPENKYDAWNGTSMATPQVAGLIAVLKSFKPELTTSDVYDLLTQTGSKSEDNRQSGKIIRADKALESILK